MEDIHFDPQSGQLQPPRSWTSDAARDDLSRSRAEQSGADQTNLLGVKGLWRSRLRRCHAAVATAA